jgi:hypothetical protein
MLFDVCLNGAMRLKVVNVEADSMAEAALKAQRFAWTNLRDAELCRGWPAKRDGRTRIAYAEVMDDMADSALVDHVNDDDYHQSRWFKADEDEQCFVLGPSQAPEPQVERRSLLVLSTAHLTRATRDALTAGLANDYPVLASFGHGWYVHVPSDPEWSPSEGNLPADLVAAIAFGRRLGACELKFDCDAGIVEGLPVYEDEP